MTRRYNPQRASLHRNYTAKELCALFDVSMSTLRSWTKNGLQPIDRQRPFLFAGINVRSFIERHNKPRQPTDPGEIYCVACKRVIVPDGEVVDYVPRSCSTGDFWGRCPNCHRLVPQRVRRADIERKAGKLKVQFEDGSTTMGGSSPPSQDASTKGE